MSDNCVFCDKITKKEVIGQFCYPTTHVALFEPLNPVVPGHMLFVPSKHVGDASEDILVTGDVFTAAGLYARQQRKPFNLITSAGTEATQSVFHLHVHYVPRREGDGLHLPWTGQKK